MQPFRTNSEMSVPRLVAMVFQSRASCRDPLVALVVPALAAVINDMHSVLVFGGKGDTSMIVKRAQSSAAAAVYILEGGVP